MKAKSLLPQFFKKREFSYAEATEGLKQILWGLFKKIVIADNKELDAIFSEEEYYYNFNKMIELNDSLHFSDARHLNQNGVEEYNKFFIKSLEGTLNRSK